MIWLKVLPSGPFQTNAFLLGADDSDEAVLIDAPPECFTEVQNVLVSTGRHLVAVLITHPHFDHILDARWFFEEGIPVYAHSDAVEDIEQPETLGLVPAPEGGYPGARVNHRISGGELLSLAGLELSVLEVPGHSPGSLAFSIPDSKVCFPGDVIFRGSIGRTDLPGGDFEVLAGSIRTAIYSLDDATVLYPGHGPETTVAREKKSNPFVKV